MRRILIFLVALFLATCQTTSEKYAHLEKYLKNIIKIDDLPQVETQLIIVDLESEGCVIQYLKFLNMYKPSKEVIIVFSGKFYQEDTKVIVQTIKNKFFRSFLDSMGIASRYEIGLSKITAYKIRAGKIVYQLKLNEYPPSSIPYLLSKF